MVFLSKRKDAKLNQSEISELVEKIKEGDLEARNMLAMSCYPMMRMVCDRAANNHEDRENLRQEGVIALIEAANRHKADYAFSTYAMFWIRKHINLYFLQKKFMGSSSPDTIMREGLHEGNHPSYDSRDWVEWKEMSDLVEMTLDELSQEEQDILFLYLEKKTIRQICTLTKVSMQDIKEQLEGLFDDVVGLVKEQI